MEPAASPGVQVEVPAADHELAADLATRAGELLLALRAAAGPAAAARQVLRDDGDRRSHRFLVDALAAARPMDCVLSEEGVDDPRRLIAERVWIIDPLDGTREFGEAGRDDWAVHVALVVGGYLAAGAVALPALGLTLSTATPPLVPPAPAGVPPRLVVSRTRPPPVAVRIAAALDAEVLPMGSAGAKAMAVVSGTADVYAHAGGQYEWDSAAPAAVALAAGLHISRIDGTELAWNKPDPWQPDLLVCRRELAEAVLAVVHAAPVAD
ncbi:MAG: 3'(2'),5'-bisphosphate nucleotidase CysQ [Acidimicrobiia bacterium]|jgi:3'(2'), 5'-bisphosphate nucleotidase|nr:3'(2'),5'-bisphosphate nucleotidase CysQ [Acidimicrobiia bacterium]